MRQRFFGLAAIGLALCAVGSGSAAGVTVAAGVAAGPLTVSTSAPGLGALQVVDATGSGRGWRVAIGAARPTSGVLRVIGVDVAASSGRAPANRVGYPLAVRLDATSATIFAAAPDSGMGSFELVPRIEPDAAVPREIDLVVSIASGP